MKKIFATTMMLVAATMTQAMMLPTATLKDSLPKQVKKHAKDSRVVAVVGGAALLAYKNGMQCPLAEKAKAPIAIALSAFAAWEMLKSEDKRIKYGAAVPAALALLLVAQPVK